MMGIFSPAAPRSDHPLRVRVPVQVHAPAFSRRIELTCRPVSGTEMPLPRVVAPAEDTFQQSVRDAAYFFTLLPKSLAIESLADRQPHFEQIQLNAEAPATADVAFALNCAGSRYAGIPLTIDGLVGNVECLDCLAPPCTEIDLSIN